MVAGKPKILIVDDEIDFSAPLKQELKRENYEPMVAYDFEGALNAIYAQKPDLILLDIKFDDEPKGLEILEIIRSQGITTPVVMISAYGTLDNAKQALKHGAYDFLEKPVSPQKVIVTVRNTLEHHRLIDHHNRLQKQVKEQFDIIGKSEAIVEIRRNIHKVAKSKGNVLITGETGVGKELVARQIHLQSARKDGPFIDFNCSAVPKTLIESELFGYDKGAFTDAARSHAGKFEQANGGTLLLDEIGDMELSMQAKILNAIEDHCITPLASNRKISLDVRIIAATNKDIDRMVQEKSFRDDLYYRLGVFTFHVPPLRERTEDIELLCEHFLQRYCKENRRKIPEISPEALQVLMQHTWAGNVRELKNTIERIVCFLGTDRITKQDVLEHLKPGGYAQKTLIQPESGKPSSLSERLNNYEKSLILEALLQTDYHVTSAAERLGIDRSLLHKKCKRLGIKLPKRR